MNSLSKYMTGLAACLVCLCSAANAQEKAVDGEPFLRPTTKRDSILIADQLYYGITLKNIPEGSRLDFPDWEGEFTEGVEILAPWQLDTLSVKRQGKEQPRLFEIESKVLLASFDEGEYELPGAEVYLDRKDGITDTLSFDGLPLSVKTIAVDTATFKIHDIKGQIRYPITFKEVLPWIGLGLLIIGITLAVIYLLRKFIGKSDKGSVKREPAHIVALRKLDTLRGDKLWVPEKQKIFYSGITDTLREYIAARYDISAMEMTTSEIFEKIADKDIPSDLFEQTKEMFERADFVKFAKHSVGNEENASAVPTAVRFVTTTYQEQLDKEVNTDTETEKN